MNNQQQPNKGGLNERIGKVIDALCKERGIFRNDLASGTGVSKISLSITLSDKSPSVISTKKLLEIATVLQKHLVIGFLDDDQVEEFKSKLISQAGDSHRSIRYCPNCGARYDISSADQEKAEDEANSLVPNFVVCDFVEINKEDKEEQKTRRLETYKRMGKKIAQKKEG